MNEPMTRAIARSIVRVLSANFGPWEDDRRDLWEGKVADLEDGEAAWLAAQALIDNHEGARVRFAEFKTAYSGALRQLHEQRSRERGLNRPERNFGIPAWVYVWTWARRYRDPVLDPDTRLPQQVLEAEWEPNPAKIKTLTEDEYDALHSEWVTAGAPRFDPRKVIAGAR